MQNHDFDDILKARLYDIRSSNQVRGWETLHEKLTSSQDLRSDFDSVIRGKISQPISTLLPSDWDKFSAKLNNIDQDFDNQIAERLENIQVPPSSVMWENLYSRLNAIALLKQKIYGLKVFECILIPILLFTFINIFHIVSPRISKSFQKEHLAAINKQENLPSVDLTDVKKESLNNLISQNSGRGNLPQNEVTPSKRVSPISHVLHTQSTANVKNVMPNDLSAVMVPRTTSLPSTAQSMPRVDEQFAAFEQLESISASIDYQRALPILLDTEKPHNESQWSLHILSGMHLDKIQTPKTGTLIEQDRTMGSYGSHVGLLLSYDLPHLSLESGIVHSIIGYRPRLNEIISENGILNHIQLKDIGFTTLAMPIQAKLFFHTEHKNVFYVLAGIQPGFITKSRYHIDSETTESIVNNPSFKSEILDKNYRAGILEGGNFSGNFFAYGNAGIGMQNSLTPGVKMYGQMVYHARLSDTRFGPTNDKINMVSATIGIKVNLK